MAKIVQSVSPYNWSSYRQDNWIDFKVPYEDGDQIVVFVWFYYSSTRTEMNIVGFSKYPVNKVADLYLKKMQGSGVLSFRALGRGGVPYLNGTAHVIRGAKPIVLSSAKSGLNSSFTFTSQQSNVVLSFVGSLDNNRVDNVGISGLYKREAGSIITAPYNASVISYSESAGTSIRTYPAAAFNVWNTGVNFPVQLPIENGSDPKLFLVRDGDIIKTYKNNTWQTI